MKQEDKDLLLADLCARLPYDIVCEMWPKNGNKIVEKLKLGGLNQLIRDNWEIKPYLFPLSSVRTTFEGAREAPDSKSMYSLPDSWRFSTNCIGIRDNESPYINICDMNDFFDWCNKNHIDYRGWIDKEMALDATGLNIY